MVSRENGSIAIEDLGSYNGIRINGARITGKVVLKESDRVQIGDYVLQVTTEDAAEADGAATQPLERVQDISAFPAPAPGQAPVVDINATLPMNMDAVVEPEFGKTLRELPPLETAEQKAADAVEELRTPAWSCCPRISRAKSSS